MKWKFVFNSTVGGKWWGDINRCHAAAKECGYQFFTWNGRVYIVIKDGWQETEILIDDLI